MAEWAIELGDRDLCDDVCWLGCLDGYVRQVLDAGESAVMLSPGQSLGRDTQGIARALIGDSRGAIEDFEAVVRGTYQTGGRRVVGKGRREEWLASLRAGRNPLDMETLRSLRKEEFATSK